MSRVKRGVTSHAKHKRTLKRAEGFYGRSYVLAQALAFQGLGNKYNNAHSPIVAPSLDFSYVGAPRRLWGCPPSSARPSGS